MHSQNLGKKNFRQKEEQVQKPYRCLRNRFKKKKKKKLLIGIGDLYLEMGKKQEVQ